MINILKRLGKVRVSRLTGVQISGLPEALRELYSVANGVRFPEPFDLEIMPLSKVRSFQSEEWLDLCGAWISAVPFASSSTLRSFVAVATLNRAPLVVHIDADDVVVRPIADSVLQFLELLANSSSSGGKSLECWPSSQLYEGAQLLDHFNFDCVDIGLASRYARSMSAFQLSRIRDLDSDAVRSIVGYKNEDLIEAMLLELRRRGKVSEVVRGVLRSLLNHENSNIALDARLLADSTPSSS